MVAALVAAIVSLVAGAGPSAAAADPSQQFMTSAVGTASAPGQSIALTFGASGVTGSYTLSTVNGGGHVFAAGDLPGANVLTYLEPDPPAGYASVAQTTLTTSSVIGTVVLSQPVDGLILHVVNPDASTLAVGGTSTTGAPITLVPLVKNNEMEIIGNTLNSTAEAPANSGCETDAGDNPNGACGSISLTAASGLIKSFSLTSTGTAAGNDGWRWTLSFDPIEHALQTCSAAEVRATQRYWYFGLRANIDFGVSGNTATPGLSPATAGDISEGSTVVTDSAGNLQFWSDGGRVLDRNSVVMPNGAGLLGSADAAQPVAAFPSSVPGRYFVVTNSAVSPTLGTLRYSIVDMTLNGGLGDVTTKNVQLGAAGTSGEGLNAIPNADGTGFWVLTYEPNQPRLLAYEFDGNGPVTGVAVPSTLSTVNPSAFGSINISPDLTQIALLAGAGDGGEAHVLDFDAATGVAIDTFAWTLPAGRGGYAMDFSPSGDYVYVSRIFGTPGGELVRYRIAGAVDGAAVLASAQTIGSGYGIGGAVRRGPDGNMYVANRDATALGVVTNPDALAPTFVANGLPLAAGSLSRYGLSQTVTGCAPPTTPAAPTGVTATATSPTGIALSWDPVAGATSYEVFRSTTPGGPYTGGNIVTGTSYADNGLTPGTTYYYVVQAINVSGSSVNSVEVSATTPAAAPGVSLTKSAALADADADGVADAGEQINYSFVVTNTGNVTLTGVAVADALPGLSAPNCPATTLAPGASITCTASYVVTQAGVDAGTPVVNSATASGTPPGGAAPVASAPSTTSTPVAAAAPGVSLTKSAVLADTDADGRADAGEQVNYSFLVTNTGNVTLTGVAVADALPGLSAVSCPATTLAPGAATTCTASYVVTQAGVDAGTPVVNSATASGTPPGGAAPVASAPSTTSTPVSAAAPGVSLTKSAVLADADADGRADAGEQINYSFLVANTGNVTLTGVAVADALPGLSAPSCPATTLAPGASITCTASYVVTQAGVDAGTPVVNSATASGTPPGGAAPVQSAPSTTSTPVAAAAPGVSLTKSAVLADTDADGRADAGEQIDYSFLVTNTGNVTLTGVAVADALPGLSAVSCPATTLAPGAATTCTASYVVTQAGVDAGTPVVNSATASGTPPGGAAPVASAPSTTSTPVAAAAPALTLTKSAVLADADADGRADAGERIDYSFLVTNTGNVTLTGVAVADALPGLSALSCPATSLTPGATCTASYVVTQADVDAGTPIVNSATASGTPPGGAAPVQSAPSTTSTPVAAPAPALTLTKSAVLADADADGRADAGERIDYSFLATNTGNVTLSGVAIADALPGLSGLSCPANGLAPGASTTCTASYAVTQADVNAAVPVVNSATATGTPPGAAAPVASTPSSTSTPVAAPAPALTLTKSAVLADTDADGRADAGERIDYSFLATNTGNVTLSGVAVADALPGLSGLSCPANGLAPGAATTCTASYVVTQAGVDAGTPIVNSATASGTPPGGAAPVSSAPSTTSTPVATLTTTTLPTTTTTTVPPPPTPSVPNEWTLVRSMPTVSADSSSAAAPCPGPASTTEICVYVVGGSGPGNSYLSTVQVYHPATNTWTLAAPLPSGRVDVGVASGPCPGALRRTCVYAIGGLSPGVVHRANLVYDPTTDTWAALADMPTARHRLAAASAPCPSPATGTCIYAVGGTASNGATLATTEVYNPATNTWTTADSLTNGRWRFGLAAAPCPVVTTNTCLYAVGGNASPGTTEIYDPTTNLWSPGAPLPTPRGNIAAAAAPCTGDVSLTCIYVMGGFVGGAASAITEAYNPATNTWTTEAPMKVARNTLSATSAPCPVAMKTCIYVAGGAAVAGGGYLASAEVYEPAGTPPATTTTTTTEPPTSTTVPPGTTTTTQLPSTTTTTQPPTTTTTVPPTTTTTSLPPTTDTTEPPTTDTTEPPTTDTTPDPPLTTTAPPPTTSTTTPATTTTQPAATTTTQPATTTTAPPAPSPPQTAGAAPPTTVVTSPTTSPPGTAGQAPSTGSPTTAAGAPATAVESPPTTLASPGAATTETTIGATTTATTTPPFGPARTGPAEAVTEPNRETASPPGGRDALAIYDPADHVKETLALEVSAFALLALIGTAHSKRGENKRRAGRGGGHPATGAVAPRPPEGGPGGRPPSRGAGGEATSDSAPPGAGGGPGQTAAGENERTSGSAAQRAGGGVDGPGAGGTQATSGAAAAGDPSGTAADGSDATSGSAAAERRTGAATGTGADQGGGEASSAMSVIAAAGAKRRPRRDDDETEESEEGGEVVFTEVESAEALLGPVVVKWGDRSWTWRSPFTPALDRLSVQLPSILAPRSILGARILNDAGYLRAMLGSCSALLPVLGAVLGVLAALNVHGEALPPHVSLAIALAVLGVFDALAGVIGVAVFVAAILIFGGVSSADEARTLLGVATLWFAAPLIAGTARPLRRPPTLTLREHWERSADVVIASLVGAWAVQTIVLGLPGLARLDLPIADKADSIALVVLGALIVRMIIETVAAHWYPTRLSQVQPAEMREPGPGQRLGAQVLILAVFVFVVISYMGPCWQLYVGGALFILPKILDMFADRFPNFPGIYKILPTGIVETVLMLVVGAIVAAVVLSHLASGREAIRTAFVILSLPGLALALLGLVGREGPDRELPWRYQLLGIPVLAFGVLLVLGTIAL